MKATIVPAQVTTVEDRIAGNLGLSQLMLLAVPVFGGSLLFAILPPSMGLAMYKLVVITIVAVICCILSIRIKGRIILLWLVMILRYNVRPRLYLFNKNTPEYREDYPAVKTEKTTIQEATPSSIVPMPRLDFHEAARVLARIENPDARLRFETTKKGGLHVRLTEIEE